MGMKDYLMVVMLVVICLIAFTCFILALDHNSDLSRTLIFVLEEHEKLIDRMHEGTLILSKSGEAG